MIAILFTVMVVIGIVTGVAGERLWQLRDRSKENAVQKAKQKLDAAEALIVQLYDEAQDKQMRRLDLPKLETGILIPIIFHRERIEIPNYTGYSKTYDYQYTPWMVVADYGKKRESAYINIKAHSDMRKVTDQYKSHTLLVKWNQIPQPTQYTVTLPEQNPVATMTETRPEPIRAEVVPAPTPHSFASDRYTQQLQDLMDERRNSATYQNSSAFYELMKSSYR